MFDKALVGTTTVPTPPASTAPISTAPASTVRNVASSVGATSDTDVGHSFPTSDLFARPEGVDAEQATTDTWSCHPSEQDSDGQPQGRCVSAAVVHALLGAADAQLLIVLDEDQIIQQISTGVLAMLGFTPAEVVGWSFARLLAEASVVQDVGEHRADSHPARVAARDSTPCPSSPPGSPSTSAGTSFRTSSSTSSLVGRAHLRTKDGFTLPVRLSSATISGGRACAECSLLDHTADYAAVHAPRLLESRLALGPSGLALGAMIAVVVTNVSLTAAVERRHASAGAAAEAFRLAFEHAPTAMALLSLTRDGFGVIRRANNALATLTARSCSELNATPVQDLLPLEDAEKLTRALRAADQASTGEPGDPAGLELRFLRPDNSIRWAQVNIAALTPLATSPTSPSGTVSPSGQRDLLVTVYDVTAARATAHDLARAALHDPLTGLANRVLLMDRLQLALTAERRARVGLSVLFVDLDGFKPVNDRYGHAGGDAVLQEVARRLVSVMRGEDTVARWGGDEFAVVCPGLGPADLPVVLARLRRALGAPVQLPGGGLVEVGASVGAACGAAAGSALAGVLVPVTGGLVLEGPSAEELLAAADAAMYAVKAPSHRGSGGHHRSGGRSKC